MKKKICIIIIAFALLFLIGCNACGLTSGTSLDIAEKWDSARYEDVLADYETLVTFRLSPSFENDWNNGEIPVMCSVLKDALQDETSEMTNGEISMGASLSNMIVEMTDGLTNPQRGDYGYALNDINGDAIPELFWIRKDQVVLAIFTVQNNQPVLLDAFWPKYKCVITGERKLLTISNGGAGYSDYIVKELSVTGKLEPVTQFGMDGGSAETGTLYYEIISGEKASINEARFYELLQEYPFEMGDELLHQEIVSMGAN